MFSHLIYILEGDHYLTIFLANTESVNYINSHQRIRKLFLNNTLRGNTMNLQTDSQPTDLKRKKTLSTIVGNRSFDKPKCFGYPVWAL